MTAALLVVDAQNDVLRDVESADETVEVIAQVVQDARSTDHLVVWVQHDEPNELPVDSEGWQLVTALRPVPSDLRVRKQHRSAFAGTGLAEALRARGVSHVVLTGAQSAFCVDMAGKHALVEGFDVTLVSDGHCNGVMQIEDGELSDAQVRGLINRTWSSLRHPDGDVRVVAAVDLEW